MEYKNDGLEGDFPFLWHQRPLMWIKLVDPYISQIMNLFEAQSNSTYIYISIMYVIGNIYCIYCIRCAIWVVSAYQTGPNCVDELCLCELPPSMVGQVRSHWSLGKMGKCTALGHSMINHRATWSSYFSEYRWKVWWSETVARFLVCVLPFFFVKSMQYWVK